ncbi:hypothetical protein COH20_010779 [Aspergillus flavus]|nr:hypothetical protein COH21_011281 [Aspergillus flavus]RAQ76649.1 hypothetical protein COH20_010779 [Aspergillus flavus]
MSSFWKKRSLKVRDGDRTRAAELTLRESLYPICLVTSLFFLWGFSYGLLDTLNKHFQETLNISQARSSGLQAAYFGAYPLAPLGHPAWILRHYGYRAVYIWGLFLTGDGLEDDNVNVLRLKTVNEAVEQRDLVLSGTVRQILGDWAEYDLSKGQTKQDARSWWPGISAGVLAGVLVIGMSCLLFKRSSLSSFFNHVRS